MPKRLVLIVGIPASGKTTLSQRLIERGYTCFSADEIREQLWGDAADQREPERVFALFFSLLEKALLTGLDIVIDNTNINSRHRGPILERARQAGYTDIQLWVLDVPLEICLERNRARQRSVPEDIVTNMFNTLLGPGKPKRHEGKIVIIRPGNKENDFRFFLPG